jgi:hypothetical protein
MPSINAGDNSDADFSPTDDPVKMQEIPNDLEKIKCFLYGMLAMSIIVMYMVACSPRLQYNLFGATINPQTAEEFHCALVNQLCNT